MYSSLTFDAPPPRVVLISRWGGRAAYITHDRSKSIGRTPAEPDPRPAGAVPSVAYVGDRSRASTRSVAATPSPDALAGRGGGGPGEGSAAATPAAATDRPATVTLRFRTSRVRAFSATLVFPARARRTHTHTGNTRSGASCSSTRASIQPSSGRTLCNNVTYVRVYAKTAEKSASKI